MKNHYIDPQLAGRLTDVCWCAGIVLVITWTVLESVGIVPRGASELVSRVSTFLLFVLAAIFSFLSGSKSKLIWCIVCAIVFLLWCFCL